MIFPVKSLASAIVAGVAVTLATGASADWLQNDQAVRSLVAGKRVYLSVPLGGEFPLHYRRGGEVTGDGSGLGLGRYFAPKETGEWWVDGGKLCQRFPTWYKSQVNCFRLRPVSETRLQWRRDDGYSGRARIEP
jgi:hypothetical protein